MRPLLALITFCFLGNAFAFTNEASPLKVTLVNNTIVSPTIEYTSFHSESNRNRRFRGQIKFKKQFSPVKTGGRQQTVVWVLSDAATKTLQPYSVRAGCVYRVDQKQTTLLEWLQFMAPSGFELKRISCLSKN